MKFTIDEYKAAVTAGRLNDLKALGSVEVTDADGNPVDVETIEAPAQKATEAVEKTVAVDDAAVERLVAKAVAAELAKAGAVTTNRVKSVAVQIDAENKAAREDKPKRYSIPAEVKRTRPEHFQAKQVNGLEPDERAFRFGMFLLAAKGSPAARDYCREHGINVVERKFSDDLLQKLHQENVNTAGGYLVPEEFSSDIIDLKETYGVARRLFSNEPMMSDTKTFPRRTAGLTAYPVAEGAAGTESSATWDQVRLTAKDWMVLTRMTNQLSADAVISVADKLAFECAYAHTLKEDQTAFLGTGTSTYGGITGLAQAFSNKWSTGTAAVGTGLVKQGTGTTWGAIVLADFDNVVGSLPQYADRPDTAWVMHRSFYYSIVEKLIQAQGGVPAYETRQGQRAPRPLFKGYPVEFAQVMPSTTASAQVSAYLGSFKLAASFGDRQQDQIAFSTEASVGGQSVFERNETAVRSIARWDINVHDIGDGTTPGPVIGLITG